MRGLLGIIYLVIGVLVAANRDQLGDINSVMDLVDMLLAVLLWPLILFGVEIDLGGEGGRERRNALPALPYIVTGAKKLAGISGGTRARTSG